ncbi:MAG: hypothetical protein WC663_02620 [Patescibacteria group bacterium]|jgi:hypothetical protein
MAEERERFDQLICKAIKDSFRKVFFSNEVSEERVEIARQTLRDLCEMLETAAYKKEHIQETVDFLKHISYDPYRHDDWARRCLDSCIYRLKARVNAPEESKVLQPNDFPKDKPGDE